MSRRIFLLALLLTAGAASPGPADARIAPVLVVTRTVLTGETITASMFAVERRGVRRVPDAALSDPAEAIGQLAARTLVAGTVLREADLVRPQSVRRKDVVSLAALDG